jgi:ATP-binding cassette subfamily F protein 3
VLDEPTNHLDVDSREALILAINDYEGAVIIISHDRHLIETCADRLWLVKDGTVKPFDGDMEDYTRLVLQGSAQAMPPGDKPGRQPRGSRVNPGVVKKKLVDIEAKISQLQEKIAILDRALEDPQIYSEEPRKAADFAKLRAKLANDIEEAETAWLLTHEQMNQTPARA